MSEHFSDFQHELGEMVGTSAPMLALLKFIRQFGPTDLTVLIQGESGTGKELVARALHRSSARSAGVFVPVNCAELTETLVQSELFGHERGAFTGADRQHLGWFERASGGTLFLDEIGELSLPLQGRFLRVLQERKIHRLGGTRPVDVDVRIIAATNVDLDQAVADRLFREDLYYRINVLSITTPPLRDRREDIRLLARHFMRRFEGKTAHASEISPETAAMLERYPWPGNIRELQNVIERATLVASRGIVQPQDLPQSLVAACIAAPADRPDTEHDLLWEVQRAACRIVMAHTGGNVRRAAEIVGHQPTSFYRTLKRLLLNDLIGPHLL
jgi:DNA-binding NtrC family response regulator